MPTGFGAYESLRGLANFLNNERAGLDLEFREQVEALDLGAYDPGRHAHLRRLLDRMDELMLLRGRVLEIAACCRDFGRSGIGPGCASAAARVRAAATCLGEPGGGSREGDVEDDAGLPT